MKSKIILTSICTLALVGTVGVGVFSTNFNKSNVESNNSAVNNNASYINDQLNVNLSTGTAFKDETVYVVADATGEASKIIVEDWLKNNGKFDVINDKSSLTGITNVKDDRNYSSTTSGIDWSANKTDIHYKGTSTNELPVQLSIKYYLDGNEVSHDNISGKTGKLKMVFNYKNNTLDKETNKYVPFVALSTMLLDSDTFTNVSVDFGKVIDLGSKKIVLGYGLPGLKENLDLKGLDDSVNARLNESFTITADVTDYNLDTVMTIVDNSLLTAVINNITTSIKNNTDLTSNIDSTKEIVTKANNIISILKDQLDTMYSDVKAEDDPEDASVYEKLQAIKTYLTTLETTLKDGLTELTSHDAELIEGSKKVFNTFLAQVEAQLKAAGYDVTLTIDNYSDTVTTIMSGIIATVNSQLADKGQDVTITLDDYSTKLTALINGIISNVNSQLAESGFSQTISTSNYSTTIDEVIAIILGQVEAQLHEAGTDVTLTNDNYQATFDSVISGILGQVSQQLKAQGQSVDLTKDNYKTIIEQTVSGILLQVQTKLTESGTNIELTTANYQAVIDQTVSSILAQTSSQLKEMGQDITLTRDNYSTVLSQIIASLTDESQANTKAKLESVKGTLDQLIQAETSVTNLLTAETSVTNLLEAKASLTSLLQAKAGLDQLETAKGSLDEYNMFYVGLSQYIDGVEELRDSLNESLKKIDGLTAALKGQLLSEEDFAKIAEIKEEIHKFSDLYQANKDFKDNVNKTLEKANSYYNYSGITDGSVGCVKFIIRTKAI